MAKYNLCLDPTQLNKYIVHPHHNAKLVEDLLPNLSGVKIFSIVDTCSSFCMMTLSKESSYLTTFATMFQRYQYVRVPMGASLSRDCFQYKMDQIFGPIVQCCGITDGLVIYSYSEENHDCILFQVLDMAKHVGLRFNPDKCIFKCTEIPFSGMLIGADGIRPDPKKTEALNLLPLPGNVMKMQSFLSIVNYLSTFSPKIANLTGS